MPYKTKFTTTTRARGTSLRQQADWNARYGDDPDYLAMQPALTAYVEAIRSAEKWSHEVYNKVVQRVGREGHPIIPKAHVRRGYLALVQAGLLTHDEIVLHRLQLKPTRTQSGVAPVTVLTKPYPCPGKCIFCPTDIRMPKSYLANEPGAMRALILNFDPFEQVDKRIRAMQRTGHLTDKVELLILGGTWSAYPADYRVWFVRRCFDALNRNYDSAKELHAESIEWELLIDAHKRNETAQYRNVGLVIETRPDRITVDEVHHLRRLGVTRIQLGIQTLDDQVSLMNRRGETSADARIAMQLLRSSGFKVAVHVMPNLYGANLESDIVMFRKFWDDPAMRPDEMKIYPVGLIHGTELQVHYQRGEYQPYTEDELTALLVEYKKLVPRYCRLNRVMRDIPAPEIISGVTASNLRQTVQKHMRDAGTPCECVRCREVRQQRIDPKSVDITPLEYDTDHSREIFIQANTRDDKLAGFLRLSLPASRAVVAEIDGAAMIRQVQVYGPVVALDESSDKNAQHQGIGSKLIHAALDYARAAGYQRIGVIAAVGTREYYRRFGFKSGELYMLRSL